MGRKQRNQPDVRHVVVHERVVVEVVGARRGLDGLAREREEPRVRDGAKACRV